MATTSAPIHGLLDHGGTGVPIILLHGLMGRGATWFHHVYWLRNYGRIFTFDAAFHRGEDMAHYELTSYPEGEILAVETERFVADIAEILHWIDLGPAILIGHSMGALHAWCTASMYPELVSALVLEDMVPEFRGQTTHQWTKYFRSWPYPFVSLAQAQEFFGSHAGKYFWSSFDNGYPHGNHTIWENIAACWGHRDFWQQWYTIEQPTLLIQGEHGIDHCGLMSRMAENPAVIKHVVIPKVGHLAHDENTVFYRGAVEAFLAGFLQCYEN